MQAEFKQVRDIFLMAVEKASPEEREAYLRDACGGNVALRRQVEALLRRHEDAGNFLERPAFEEAGTGAYAPDPSGEGSRLRAVPTEAVGVMIGPYKLVQQLGEGGMGTVWVAEQVEPVKRRVALKLIKPGMDSAQILHRFEAERQALALMDHTNIARVLDAGATDKGRPYFVMELVKGVPITKYCDQLHLSLRERLELFVPICQAIQHAHQKGIIHRDIKPTNVLVAIQDGKPVPKVIDFGVAKALHQRLTDNSIYTEIGQVVGTLEYMSPEQAELSALDIDTRTDVYALGVMLYELLTGTTPLDRKRLKQAAYAEMLRIIREDEPPRPSTRLTDSKESIASLAAQRRTEPARLTREVRGELDWIVMKCLEKDRTRRYETANGLARDIERHLHDEPVEACPPSARYRLGKFLGKHRAGVVTAAAFLLLLLAGAVVSAWQAVRASQAEQAANADRDRALRAEDDAKLQRDKAVAAEKGARESQADLAAFSEFLVQDILAAARPPDREGGGLGINVTVKAALDAAAPKLRQRFQGKPWAEFLCSHALGKTYDRRGDLAAAEPLLRRAWELCRQFAPADDRRLFIIPNNLSALLTARGKETEAAAILEEALQLATASGGPNDADTLLLQCNLGRAYSTRSQGARALPLLEEAHRRVQDTLGDRHELAVVSKNFLATAYLQAGRYDEAVALFEQALRLAPNIQGRGQDHTLALTNNLALAYVRSNRPKEAIPMFAEVLRRNIERVGPNHPDTFLTMRNLAGAYQDTGRLQEAIAQYEKAAELSRAKLGLEHRDTLTCMHNLGNAYQRRGEYAKAEQVLKQVLEVRRGKEPESRDAVLTLGMLGKNYLLQSKFLEAEPLLRSCVQIYEKKQDDSWESFQVRSLLGAALAGRHEYAEAEPLLVQGYEGLRQREAKIPRQGKVRLTEALNRLVQLYEAWGKKDAVAHWRKELEAVKKLAEELGSP